MGERHFESAPNAENVKFTGITLTFDRYAELLNAERDANMLKGYISQVVSAPYGSISCSEIETIAKLFGLLPKEPEDESEGENNG